MTREPDGNLTCGGVAYPMPTLRWTREPSGPLPGVQTRSTLHDFDYSIISTLGLSQSSCPPGVAYKCTVAVSASTNIQGEISFYCRELIPGPPM